MERQVWIGFLRHTENINMTSSYVTLKRIGKTMAMAQAYFHSTITNVLGIFVKQREVLYNDRYDTISTIIYWKYDKIHDWFTTKYKLTTTRGGASYGDHKIKFLQALAWWATDFTARVKQIFLACSDATVMVYCIYQANLDYEDMKKAPYIEKPDKFSDSKWVAW